MVITKKRFEALFGYWKYSTHWTTKYLPIKLVLAKHENHFLKTRIILTLPECQCRSKVNKLSFLILEFYIVLQVLSRQDCPI
jgi:hypothetical protein